MDGTRIDKILVVKMPEEEAAETDAKANKQNNKAPAAGRGFNFIQTLFLKFKGCGTV